MSTVIVPDSGSYRLQPTTLWLDRLAFREQSKILEQFHRRDFSYIRRELRRIAPRSCDRMVSHNVPFVARYAEELSQHYVRPPVRKWVGVPDASSEELKRIYKGLRIDRFMLRLHEVLMVQRTVVVVALPNRRGGLTLWMLAPHSVEVDPDPTDPESLSSALAIRCKIPVLERDDVIQYGILEMTPRKISLRGADGFERGVWAPDMRNPFRAYPAFAVRLGIPQAGDFFCPAPEDLLQTQVALNIALTLSDWIGRYQSWGQAVVTGMKKADAEKWTVGPDTILGLEEGETFDYKQAQATLEQYLKSTRAFLEYTLSLNNISPDLLLKGRSLTALARQMDMLDRETSRARQEEELRGAEQGLYSLIRDAYEVLGMPLELPRDSYVEVTYAKPMAPVDPLHDAQAAAIRREAGLESAAEQLAKERNVSLEDAQEIVERNRAADAPEPAP
jgi:hypothetical protein